MRHLRAKHIRKSLKFFQFLCGIKAPYKVLLDGNFIAMCIQMKIDIFDRVPKFLQTKECKFFVPQAVLHELKLLGNEMSEAIKLCRHFVILDHDGRDRDHDHDRVDVSQAMLDLIGDSNAGRFIVATQEQGLRSALRKIPGVPIMYLNRSVLVFEEISQVTLDLKNSSSTLSKREAQQVTTAVEQMPSSTTVVASGVPLLRRKRKAKGPNPLSRKKKVGKPKVRSKRKCV